MERILSQISAHRTGSEGSQAKENTLEGLFSNLDSGAEYVEFDVHESRDRVFVLYHDEVIEHNGVMLKIKEMESDLLINTYGLITLDKAVDVIKGRMKAHVDLKFWTNRYYPHSVKDSPEIRIVSFLLEHMDDTDFIITTMRDHSVKMIREYFGEDHPDMLVGLSIPADKYSNPIIKMRKVMSRIRQSKANLIVSHQRVARQYLYAYAKKSGLPVLIWTVDDVKALDYWIKKNVFLVTTNFPTMAVKMRERLEVA